MISLSMSCLVSSCTPSFHSWADHVSSSALAEQLTFVSKSLAFFMATSVSNSFNDRNCDIVGLRSAYREILNCFQQFVFQVFGSSRCLHPYHFLHTIFPQHFSLWILGLG